MLKRALVFFARLLLFLALVWMAVAAYWKYTDHVVSSEDLLLYFLILPVALLLAYFTLRLLLRAAKKAVRFFRAAAPVQTAAHAAPQVDRHEDGSSAGPLRPVYVVSTAMSTHFGDEGFQFLDAVLQARRRAGIDERMTRELGYGVRVAGVEQIEADARPADEDARATMQRSRELLQRVLLQLEPVLHRAAPAKDAAERASALRGVQLHPEWYGATPHPGEPEVPAATQGTLPASLSVHVVLPDFLTSQESAQIEAGVIDSLHAFGWPRQAVQAVTLQPENDIAYLRRLDAWLRPPPGEASAAEWLLVLGAVSWLDPDLLAARLNTDLQFADRLARGGTAIGELGCAVLFSKTLPASTLQLEPQARLSGIALGQRSKPVDARGTVEAGLLTDMLAAQAATLPEKDRQVVGLAASGNLQDGRAVELGRWVTDSLPQLDFIEDVLCVAEHIGECEPGGSLLALALAADMARQREGTVLFCANQHAGWRALAAVMPAA